MSNQPEVNARRVRVRREVWAEARALVGRCVVSGSQRRLLETVLDGLAPVVEQESPLLFMEVPLAVHSAAGGGGIAAVRIAAACSLVFLGADVLDDLADGDVRPGWEGFSPGELTLGAATLLSALAPLALADLGLSAGTAAALHRTLSLGLLRMAAGQQDDLRSTVSAGEITPETIEAAVVGKSGQEFAMFCSLAAQAAGASAEAAGHYAAMGMAIGTGGQIASDCFELLEDPAARDLRRGALTLPLALHLDRLSGEKRPAFRALLERARADEEARNTVRQEIRTGGALRIAVFAVETHRQRALRELTAANPAAEGRRALLNLIDELSFFDASRERSKQEAGPG